ncbi:hypothetical protein HBB16_07315 [Pseudonocardia sp. MCCB 268]|nr:hypothetical protein [Pseudonocardia cytotoxica]
MVPARRHRVDEDRPEPAATGRGRRRGARRERRRRGGPARRRGAVDSGRLFNLSNT